MPIHEPPKGVFPGERSEDSHHGGVCPLCGNPYDGMLPDHIRYHCPERTNV